MYKRQSFEFGKLLHVNVINGSDLDIVASVTVSAYAFECLESSPVVRELATDEHTDAVRISLGSIVKTSDTILLIYEVERIVSFLLLIQGAKVSSRGIWCHSSHQVVSSDDIIPLPVGVDKNGTRVHPTIGFIHHVFGSIGIKEIVDLRCLKVLLFFGSNQLITHKLH